MGKTSSAAKDKYNAKTYDQIQFRVKKGRKAELQAHAAAQGESLSAFLNRAAAETMRRDWRRTADL
ncbi:MAG: antitoxin [Eubacteriales bacterium]|nr:antitoxin [Eubacteriales bacterium]